MEKYWLKEFVCFWWRNRNCTSIAAELWGIQEKGPLEHLFQNSSSPTFWKPPILWQTAILFLHWKTFTERNVRFFMAWSGLCVNCCIIVREFNTRFLLNIHFRIPSFSPWKRLILTHRHFASWWKKKRWLHTATLAFFLTKCRFS